MKRAMRRPRDPLHFWSLFAGLVLALALAALLS